VFITMSATTATVLNKKLRYREQVAHMHHIRGTNATPSHLRASLGRSHPLRNAMRNSVFYKKLGRRREAARRSVWLVENFA